ncbi:MAG: chalcone isomerase family protein [Bdellovibrionales bacterium]|nr:chalcone isomerase family protein [Bdellovibrionales bacterium]
MKSALIALTAILSLGLSANAALLKLDPGQKSNNGVTISTGGTATIDGKDFQLTTVGSGLRSKKVLVANVKVYVAQLLVSNPNSFVRKDADALKSLEDSQTVAMQLSFLRSVEADKVKVSFRDAFDANNVDINNPAIKQLLAAVEKGGDATANGTLTFVANKHSDGTETLIYEDTAGKQVTVKGDKGLTHDVFSMWLGNPADDGIAALKKSLLQE